MFWDYQKNYSVANLYFFAQILSGSNICLFVITSPILKNLKSITDSALHYV